MATRSDLYKKIRARRDLPSPTVRRLIREQAGLSQQDIAEALGATRAAVSRWESGQREPRGDLLVAYVTLLRRLKRHV